MMRRSKAAPLLLTAALILALPWLPALLRASDPLPVRADAIYVFAGKVPERARCAAELYRAGLAPTVVFGGASVRPELEAIGSPLSDAAVNALVARQGGVPEAAEVVLPLGTSTWEDAYVLRDWIQSSGARTVVAVTSPIHSRRARRTLRFAIPPAAADVRVVACGESYPPGSGWYLDEQGLVSVTNEVLKLMLYSVRYFLPAALGLAPEPAPSPTP
jgi:uncharacterized SAM-binding protein YcdF (DUF218 family)